MDESRTDLEQRVSRLEADMTSMRELRETQLEHSQTLAEHGHTLAEHGRILAEHSHTLAEHGRALALLGQGQEQIIGMLTTLIEREPPA